ncbi:MAG: hypothetical protein ACFFDN_16855 [Candidatus Hodarchaeota archaeon]
MKVGTGELIQGIAYIIISGGLSFLIGAEIGDVDSTLEMVYTKIFQGTTDADTQTNIAHGVTSTKIVHAWGAIANSSGNYGVYDFDFAQSASAQFVFYYNATHLVFIQVGVDRQGQSYACHMKYYI